MRTNVDFNVGRTNVAAALTSIALMSMRTNVDAQKRRVALSSVAQNSRHPKIEDQGPWKLGVTNNFFFASIAFYTK